MSRNTDDWIQSYLDYTENTEPSTLFREWVAISVIGSVLQRKCFLKWGDFDLIYPNMYVVLVGPPGSRKGTAMAPGGEFLRDIGVRMAAEAVTREMLIRELANSVKIDWIEKPDGNERQITHSSLTIFSEELTVFLGYDNKQLMADLSNWFDCSDQWKYRTKTQGDDEIYGVWVNLLGATTPSLIQSTLPRDAVGGGLASRIVFVFAQGPAKRVGAPFVKGDAEAIRTNLRVDLEDIYTIKGQFKYTEGFLETYVDWYENRAYEISLAKNPNFQGYVNRRATHLRSLAIIMSASRDSSMIIDEPIFHRCLDLLERTEKKMPSVFEGFGEARYAQVIKPIMKYIIRKSGPVTQTELHRTFYADIESPRHMRDIINTLKDIGFAKVWSDDDGNTWIQHQNEEGTNGQQNN